MNLTNKWMNDSYFLTACAHSFGLWAILLTIYFLFGTIPLIVASSLFVVAAAVKEFWYDAKYELPVQTTFDNVFDFVWYIVGIAMCLIVVFVVKPHIHL